MFIRAKYLLQFWRRDDLRHNGFHPAIENLGLEITAGQRTTSELI